FGRYEADGGRPAREVPFERRRPDHLNRGGDQLVLGEQIAKLGRQLRREAVDVSVKGKKAVGKAKIVNAAKGRLGSAEGADDEPQLHQLERAGRSAGQRRGGG